MKKLLILFAVFAAIGAADTRKTRAECMVLLADGQAAGAISETDVRDCLEQGYVRVITHADGCAGVTTGVQGDICTQVDTGAQYYCSTATCNGAGWIGTNFPLFAALSEKATPTGSDYMAIFDAAASNAAKYATLGNLPAPGSSGQGVFNNGGKFAADPGFSYDYTTDHLGIAQKITAGQSSVATGQVCFNGLTSGTVCITVPDIAGTGTITLPASTTGTVSMTDHDHSGTYEPADANIMHLDDTGELAGLTEETTPGSTDLVLLELASGGAKRKVQITNLPGGSATPAGSDTEIQYNASGSFGAEGGFEYDADTDTLSVPNISISGSVSVGDGTAAGQTKYSELAANGSNFRTITVPDALTEDLTIKLPDGLPAGSLMLVPTPTTSISQMTWLTLASGVATALATPSSANLAAALTDEVGNAGGFTRGTAGSTDDCVKWDASGNLVTAGAACGGGSMNNPMTTAEDIIIAGTSGTPERLAAGGEGTVLKIVSGEVAWGTDSTGGSPAFSDVAAGTNVNALVVGTDGSLSTSGTGTIAATSVTDPELSSIAGLTSAADRLPYYTGSGTAALLTFNSTVRSWIAAPTTGNLAAAVTGETGSGALVFATDPALAGNPTAPTQTAGDNDTSIASTAFVTTAVGTARTRSCELHIWGSGTSQVLQDADDEAASCFNVFGVTETITAVRCWANAGSPTVTPIVTGGAADSILTGALTCGTGSWASGTLNGTPTLTSTSTIDANVTTAGGTATNIRIVLTLTR